jgi:hypothetical protein
VGLWLKDVQSTWDLRSNARVSVWAAAGPTLGNTGLSAYYGNRLGSVTTRYWNSLDIVPYAWDLETLRQIPMLYSPHILSSTGIELLTDLAIANAARQSYVQILPQTQAQQGTVNTSFINPKWPNFQNFMVQVIYQHLVAYASLLGFGTRLASILSQVRMPFTLVSLSETELLRSLAARRSAPLDGVTGVHTATHPLIVNLPRGVTLQVPMGSEPEYTARLVSALTKQLDSAGAAQPDAGALLKDA